MPKSLKDRVICVDPKFVRPPHEVDEYWWIARSMWKYGWLGRPLIVIPIGSKSYQASTGSHRIAAAIEVGLPKIPVLPLSKEELDVIRSVPGYDARRRLIEWPDEPLEALAQAGFRSTAILFDMDRLALASPGAWDVPVGMPWQKKVLAYLKETGMYDKEVWELSTVKDWGCV